MFNRGLKYLILPWIDLVISRNSDFGCGELIALIFKAGLSPKNYPSGFFAEFKTSTG